MKYFLRLRPIYTFNFIIPDNIREEFVSFVDVTGKTTGADLAEVIENEIDEYGLSMEDARGICADGAGQYNIINLVTCFLFLPCLQHKFSCSRHTHCRHTIMLFCWYLLLSGNMRGETKGCASRLQRKYPKCIYLWCTSHQLNLVFMQSTKILAIQNMMTTADKVLKLVFFFFFFLVCLF